MENSAGSSGGTEGTSVIEALPSEGVDEAGGFAEVHAEMQKSRDRINAIPRSRFIFCFLLLSIFAINLKNQLLSLFYYLLTLFFNNKKLQSKKNVKGSEKLENFMRDRIGCAFTDLDCLPISLLTEQEYYSGVSGVI